MPDHFFTTLARNKKSATLAQLPAIVQLPLAPRREGSRRTQHGDSAWLLPDSDSQRQPQDGTTRALAAEVQTIQSRVPARVAAASDSRFVSALLTEPEDARLTGGTRSLMRRVLGLNVPKTPRKTEVLRPVRVA